MQTHLEHRPLVQRLSSDNPSASGSELSSLGRTIVGDAVREFRPTWHTEHWCNLELVKNGSFTFRFDSKAYLTTLIVSKKGSFAHHTISEASKKAAGDLRGRILGLEINDGSSWDVDAALKKLIGRAKIASFSVSLGTDTEPDSVRLSFEDGSFAMMAFKTASLIAVEHETKHGQSAIYGVEGRDLSYKSLDMMETAHTGRETIVSTPVSNPVFIITLPPIPTKITAAIEA